MHSWERRSITMYSWDDDLCGCLLLLLIPVVELGAVVVLAVKELEHENENASTT